MGYVVSAALVVVGVIHLLPVAGVLGGERLNRLYGIRLDEPNLAILMRHRAVLFGLLGAFLLYAAFREDLQRAALCVGFVSVVSFLLISRVVGGYNQQVRRVFVADVVALLCLIAGAAAHLCTRGQPVPGA